MTDKQLAEALRDIGLFPQGPVTKQAIERGADAIEMLEWLFSVQQPYSVRPPARLLYDEWVDTEPEGTFRAFCEAKWRESRNV